MAIEERGGMFGFFKRWKRKRLMAAPFPDEWRGHLEARVPFYSHLEGAERERFHDMIKVFVGETTFEGAGGMEVDDEVRVVIAAAAVRLVLHLDMRLYDRLSTIVVYPYVYTHPDGDVVLGEAHHHGTVVLSWPAVTHGLENPRDGHDTATHEFAHVLDVADGSFEGIPPLRAEEDVAPFREVITAGYEAMHRRRSKMRKVLRDYASTNEAEFFAVATEAFFEKPRQMKDKAPELYGELVTFFGFEPDDDVEMVADHRDQVGRNAPCPCGSGRKYKRCCGRSR